MGTRNILGIATTVQCVAPTVEYAVRRIKAEILPRFPNVDDVVAVTHSYGCGVAIDAPGAADSHPHAEAHLAARQPRPASRWWSAWAAKSCSPRGCSRSELPVLEKANVIRLQDERGFAEMVAAIMDAAAEAAGACSTAAAARPARASDLVVGLQCGGSDAFSGVTCNPAVGYAADLLVRAGATVMFSEVTEVRDAIHLLTPRAATPRSGARADPRDALVRRISRRAASADRSANTTPGNKRGGLANIVEKALGSIAKAGSTAHSRGGHARRKGHRQGPGLRRHARQRFHLRHAATRFHEPARVHHRRRQPLRPGAGARWSRSRREPRWPRSGTT